MTFFIVKSKLHTPWLQLKYMYFKGRVLKMVKALLSTLQVLDGICWMYTSLQYVCFTESKLLFVKCLRRHPVKSEEKNKVRNKQSARTPCTVLVLRN